MRTLTLTLASLLLTGSTLLAQPPAPPPAPVPTPPPAPAPTLDPKTNRLDAILVQWEDTMKRVDAVVFKVGRTEHDKVTTYKDVYEGQARFLRTEKGGLASIYLRNVELKEREERIIITDRAVHHLKSSEKVMRTYVLPPRAVGNGLAEENVLGIMLNVKAIEVKRRYDLTLHKEDQHYIYLDIVPRYDDDKKDFSYARLTLAVKTMLPCQLFFRRPNGNETALELPQSWVGKEAGVTPAEFVAPALPKGWNEEKITPEQMQNGSNTPPVK